MTNDYTPTTDEVRAGFAEDPVAEYHNPVGYSSRPAEQAFDRWLAEHDKAASTRITELEGIARTNHGLYKSAEADLIEANERITELEAVNAALTKAEREWEKFSGVVAERDKLAAENIALKADGSDHVSAKYWNEATKARIELAKMAAELEQHLAVIRQVKAARRTECCKRSWYLTDAVDAALGGLA